MASLSRRTAPALAPLAALTLALAGCSAIGGGEAAPTSSGDPARTTVTLVTHDSFGLSDGLIETFEQQTGMTVEIVQPGDAGALVNQLVLTKDAPLGDLVFGIDNTFASRAVEEGVVESFTPDVPAAEDAAQYAVEGSDALTAIDFGDVCLNVDHAWFTEHGVAEPATLDDLTRPEYKDLLVVPSAVTSSPGLAFLLATVGAKGEDGWEAYWQALVANGVKVSEGWSDAYYTDFSGGGGDGPRPVVLSYASSPPFTVPEGGEEPTTGALLDTCFRQVEYAGVLTGAANPEGARQLLTFLLSDEVQADIPTSMYMYPVSSAVDLPEEWARWAPLAQEPFEVAPADVDAHREEWLATWSEIVAG
ncbi:thiamine ABC transporter substrate-binding protein [Cellulomonas fimi]|uniref:ABC transporter, periplasmic binding protein, thiB subfamily n=1 Tax=Cellulomonas fimi (strain ATCC 484 / DSM 20113 / JCM 1341 / CCUG 24087 / LMG 16345 / NBRC 15513 / NCIMB 8980 / NCTC 7547 / NRS-133) TaxID=590998 RepID=F4H6X0_CELFA|nr:thiamine ABC transporter substrate-binding protein [Cellulomonas fimi]AEE44479.1 ABC transporter, periplasmic binding protein, thiB subfamily [Cellulomonas fimi ATCC 484]NNH06622.1 thiamine ABC transporter substrate-binding protein [Cellulomonas fimi]VEH26442.1 Thiamine-binding periplasmic protein precursor [Cellulomonas fimi]